ncbi:hypothetical protein Ccrd_018737 [Cynara cardunculus var. scolymus]|uniref:Uncharacterized protein n=1 Tax=Cynara cardunculus var. scolymus TaxID=59895 RepID=A0A118K1J9_CYNCS|nr:hypothetical protein Ccrd_018737 [Cynara cardunculus var. scolymus]
MQPLPPRVQLCKISEDLKAYKGNNPKKPLLMAIKGQSKQSELEKVSPPESLSGGLWPAQHAVNLASAYILSIYQPSLKVPPEIAGSSMIRKYVTEY